MPKYNPLFEENDQTQNIESVEEASADVESEYSDSADGFNGLTESDFDNVDPAEASIFPEKEDKRKYSKYNKFSKSDKKSKNLTRSSGKQTGKISPMSGKPMQEVTVGSYNGTKIPAYICREDRVCMPVEDS